MMIVLLFRLLILISIMMIIYSGIKYLRNPQRKLKAAKEANEFYFLDDANNSKKNLQFVYKGCLFIGEKYLGATEDSFKVVDIHVSVKEPLELEGFTREDIYFLENEMLIHYPHSKIEWKHPINQLLLTKLH
ncbi:sigma-w pathway protein ysdB [Oceanobacillus chungangensis]